MRENKIGCRISIPRFNIEVFIRRSSKTIIMNGEGEGKLLLMNRRGENLLKKQPVVIPYEDSRHNRWM